MKIILSRKGFDSVNGSIPSPIMPDGTLLSLPIPSRDKTHYEQLRYGDKNYAEIINELIGNRWFVSPCCHHDPDIRPGVNRYVDNWMPAFGQQGAALTHLLNENVGPGDLFLFFGWFRSAELTKEGKYRFVRGSKPQHIIWGYLQVGEIILNPTSAEHPELAYHPHIDMEKSDGHANAIIIPRKTLSWDKSRPGYGCLDYRKELVLTAPGMSASRWDLPDFVSRLEISYHSDKSRKEDHFDSAKIGQEFVIRSGDSPRTQKWAAKLIGAAEPNFGRTRFAPGRIDSLLDDEVFVFGSNAQGMHHGGAARQALAWGAVMGQGEGRQGQTYAIPTMFSDTKQIKPHVDRFLMYAQQHPDERFLVTAIGCGIAGFSPKDIAPLFMAVIDKDIKNVCLPKEFFIRIVSLAGIGKS